MEVGASRPVDRSGEGTRGAKVARVLLLAALGVIALAGSARAGAITPMPNALKFPDTGTGQQSASQTVQFTNTSNAAATLDTILIQGGNATEFKIVNPPVLPISLAPGAGLPVEVAFAPTLGGLVMSKLSAQVRGEINTTDVTLSGTGLGPKIQVTPNPLKAGGVLFGQAVPPLAATCGNGGGATVTVTAMTITGPDAALFTLAGLPALPASVGPGQSFPFQVKFAPAAPGTATAQLEVASTDPMTPKLVVPISGTSGDPKLALDVGTMVFGNQRVNIASPTQDVTITNTGLSDLHVTGLAVTGANPTDFQITAKPNIPLTLAAGAKATFTLVFKPTMAGARAASVQINSDDPKLPMKMLAMSGVGTTPLASVTPPMIDFGKVRVGQSASQSITVTNKGTGPVLVSTLTLTGADKALFSLSLGAPFTVAPMSSSVIQVTYKPVAIAGATATVTLVSDDPNLPMFQVPLTGASTAPTFALAPTSLDFGGVIVGEAAPPQTFKMSNTGNAPLKVSAFTLTGAGASRYTIAPKPQAPFEIAAGQSMTITVNYTPRDAAMADNASVTMAVDDPNRMQGVVLLHGYGKQANISVLPMDIDFGTVTVGASVKMPITIENDGDAPLVVGSLKFDGMTQGYSVDVPAPITVAPSSSQRVNVVFAPKAAGVQAATLELDPTDMSLMPVTVALTGAAVAPMVDAMPKSIDFGPVAVGGSSDPQEIKVHNGSAKPQPIDRVASDDPHFTVDSSMLDKVLAGGAISTVKVTFQPDAEGPITGHINVYIPGVAAPVAFVTVTAEGAPMEGKPPEGGGRGGCQVGHAAPGSSLALLALAGLALVLRARRRPRAG